MIVRVLVEILIFTFIISGIIYFIIQFWKRNKQTNAEKIEKANEILENVEVEKQEKEILAKADQIKMEISEPVIKVVEEPSVKTAEPVKTEKSVKAVKKSRKSTKK